MGRTGHTDRPRGAAPWRAALLAGGGFGVLALIGLLAVLVASPDLLHGPAAKPSVTPVAATPLPGGILKIGVDLPLSGPYADQGIPAENDVQLAIEQANTAGGVLLGR